MRFKLRSTFAAVAAAAMVVTTAGIAAADSMSVGPDATVAAGTPGSFVVGLANDDNATDPVNGCNGNPNSPVTVTFSTTNAAVVAAPASVQVTGCDNPDTSAVENGVTVNYVVASGAVPGATATITGIASGGRTVEEGTGKDKVTVNGIFTSDSITVTVATPAQTDSTPPVIVPTVIGTLGDNGWYTSNVTVTWSVVDGQSTISSSSGCDSTTINTDTSGTTLTCTATSAGGTASESVTVKRDATAPGVTSAVAGTLGSNSWYTSNVTVTWAVTDAMSGVASASACVDGQQDTVSTDTTGTTLTCTATDAAGNSASGTPVTIKRDATLPAISVVAPSGQHVLGDEVNADYSCTDLTSGIANCAGPVANAAAFDTSTVGAKSFTVQASDNAGNEHAVTSNYSVGYAACGDAEALAVRQPVNANGSSTFKKGSTVPVKFQVCDANGNPVGPNAGALGTASTADNSIAGPPKIIKQSVGALTVNETPLSTTPDTAFRWDDVSQQWIFNQSTKTLTAGTTYTFEIMLNSGQTIEYIYGVK